MVDTRQEVCGSNRLYSWNGKLRSIVERERILQEVAHIVQICFEIDHVCASNSLANVKYADNISQSEANNNNQKLLHILFVYACEKNMNSGLQVL